MDMQTRPAMQRNVPAGWPGGVGVGSFGILSRFDFFSDTPVDLLVTVSGIVQPGRLIHEI
jgi:hypothetical protein